MNTKAEYLESLYIDRRHQEILQAHNVRVFLFKLLISWPVFWGTVFAFGWKAVWFWLLVKLAKYAYQVPRWQEAGGYEEYHINKYIDKEMVL